MLMKQISSLKKMDMYYKDYYDYYYTNFINFPETKDCLKNLSELRVCSNINSEFFLQLSKICHNIKSLTLIFKVTISDGIKDLIFSQKNLKSLSLKLSYNDYEYYTGNSFETLTKHSDTLLSFIFTKFSNLRILKLISCPININILIKFLVNNGKNLEEFFVNECNNSLNLIIAEYCPNLKSLYTKFLSYEIETLKKIFGNCHQLENIKTICGSPHYLGGKQLLEIVAKYSPESFHELSLHSYEKLHFKDLESFFISWKDRMSQKPITFTINKKDLVNYNNKFRKLIRKYKNLGVIKIFEMEDY
jgi:hypothetical protein